jgi:hypothetical protein
MTTANEVKKAIEEAGVDVAVLGNKAACDAVSDRKSAEFRKHSVNKEARIAEARKLLPFVVAQVKKGVAKTNVHKAVCEYLAKNGMTLATNQFNYWVEGKDIPAKKTNPTNNADGKGATTSIDSILQDVLSGSAIANVDTDELKTKAVKKLNAIVSDSVAKARAEEAAKREGLRMVPEGGVILSKTEALLFETLKSTVTPELVKSLKDKVMESKARILEEKKEERRRQLEAELEAMQVAEDNATLEEVNEIFLITDGLVNGSKIDAADIEPILNGCEKAGEVTEEVAGVITKIRQQIKGSGKADKALADKLLALLPDRENA